jgi:hypothetical protein
MRTAAAIFCCLGLFLGLSACTVTPKFKPDTSVTTPAVGHPPPPSSVEAAVSSEAFTPYAELGSSSGDGLAPSQSMSDLSKACLTDAGYPNATGPQAFAFAVFGPLTISRAWGAWGYLGVAEAAQDGFSLVPGDFRGVIAGKLPAGGTVSSAEQKAENKCQGIVGKFTSAQTSGALAGIQTLSNDIMTDVQRDPSVKAATRAWSACMAGNGYKLTDPQSAFLQGLQSGGIVVHSASGSFVSQAYSFPGSSQTKAQKQAQIALAVTDADCTQSADLAGIYFAVQASYEQQITDLNQQALAAAVIEYRTAYQKELNKLPQLLK